MSKKKPTKTNFKKSIKELVEINKNKLEQNSHVMSIAEIIINVSFYISLYNLVANELYISKMLTMFTAFIKLNFTFYKINIKNKLIVLEDYSICLKDLSNEDMINEKHLKYMEKFNKKNEIALYTLLVLCIFSIGINFLPFIQKLYVHDGFGTLYFTIISLLVITFFTHFLLFFGTKNMLLKLINKFK